MCMIGDEEYWTFYTDHPPTARKEHRCGECRRTIEKGETYWTQGGLVDGTFLWHKTCEHCTVASDWLLVVCEGWIFGERYADIYNHVLGDESELRTLPLTRLVRWWSKAWHNRAGELRSLDEVGALTEQAIEAWRAQLARAQAA